MNDPYYDILHCVDRLYNEYLKHKSLIVALDFDDTIYDFHKKGYTYTNTIELIKKCQDLKFHIVIFTGSEKEKYPLILEHCDKLGIKPCKINENAFPMSIGNNGKIYYNILLDDRAGLRESILILQMLIDKIITTTITIKNEA